jgi:hypothetical protein
MFYVVVLQNSMGFVEGETGSYIETCLTCDVDGTDEVSIKIEEAVEVKDEIPEPISLPPIKTEHQVRLQGVCVKWCQLMILVHLLQKKEIVKLHLTISCFVLYCGCHIPFEIYIAIMKRRDF